MTRERKHRLSREAYKGLIRVSFTLCADDRRTVFTDEDLRARGIDTLREKSAGYQIGVTLYNFMPDHLHLIVKGLDISSDAYEFVRQFKRMMTHGYGGTLWQEDFYDHIIRGPKDLADQLMYVMTNPTRSGITDDWYNYEGLGSLTGTIDEIIEFACSVEQQHERDGWW